MFKVEAFGWQLDIDLSPTKTHLAYKDNDKTLCGCKIPQNPLSISRYTGIGDCKRCYDIAYNKNLEVID